MNTTPLRQALIDAPISQLEQVINWLDRPWAPGRNDALRAAWHEARRSDGARLALASSIEGEVRSLAHSQERDAEHIGAHLGLTVRTAEAVAVEIARRLGVVPIWPLATTPEAIAAALRATADIARILVGDHGHHGRHRRHGRCRHGR
jgi:hypothetical protein